MKDSLFNEIEVGKPVTYKNIGTKEHEFFFVICKINICNKTVDIERYSKSTGKKDKEKDIYYSDVPLADIDFIDIKDRRIRLDPTKFFPN